MPHAPSTSAEIRKGLADCSTVGLGLVPLGLAFGVLMTQAGFDWWWAPVFSIVIYAGSMEFLAIGLLTAVTPLYSLAAAAFLVNFRHVFYGLSFPIESIRSRLGRLYAVYALTDEVYAITRARGLRPDSARAHAAYWWDIDRGHGVRADLGVERIALHQALDRLGDEQRDDLTLVVATGTVRGAAEAAGVSYKHMAARVRAARVAFYGLWFNPETPPVPPVIKVYAEKKATCVRGHSREAWNVYASTGACRQCRAEKYATKKAEHLAVTA